jgi:hypothetical protein
MNVTRNGKIARLPHAVRLELNRRLRNGEQGKKLVAWLKSQPEVQSILARGFSGRAISEQNLSEWRRGGYPEWLAHQDALERVRNLALDAGELNVAGGVLGDHLAIVLMSRYAALLARWDGTSNGAIAPEVRALRALCADIVELRRGDHSAARLKVEQERLLLERSKTEQQIQERFEKWVEQPEVKKRICGSNLSPEERNERIREIFGRASKTPPAPKSGLSAETLVEIEKAAKVL